MRRLTTVIAVLAAGALSGLLALPAFAQDADQRSQDAAQIAGPHAEHHQEFAAALAKELKLDESTVAAALDRISDQLHATETHAEGRHRAERQQEFAAALAKELNLDQSTVAAALGKVRGQLHTEGADRHTGGEHGKGRHAHG